MKDTNQSGMKPEDMAEESTKGFPIVKEENEEQGDSMFEMKKRNADGTWSSAAPVSIAGDEDAQEDVAQTEDLKASAACEVQEAEDCAPTEDLKAEQPEESEEETEISAPTEDLKAGQPEKTEEEAEICAPTEDLTAGQPEESETAQEEAMAETEQLSAEEKPAETEILSAEPEVQETVTEPEQPKKKKHIGRRIAAVIAGVAVVAVAGFSIFVYAYPNIFPGVRVADSYKLGGMTMEEAQTYIAGDVQDALYSGTISVTAKDLGTDTDKEFSLKVKEMADAIDSESAARAAYLIGREGGYFQRTGTVLNSMFTGWDISLGSSLKKGAVAAQVKKIADNLNYEPVQPSWKINEEKALLEVDTGKKGLTFDSEVVTREISDRVAAMNFDGYTIETKAVAQDKPDAAVIAADVNTEPKNASVDKNDGKTVLEAVNGVKVEEAAIKTAIGDASKQTYDIPVEITKAAVYKAELDQVLFRDKLASVTTYYSGGGGRTTNVRLAAGSVNETILNPGEEFSYNNVVGERTAARGYRGAIVYNNGQEVVELGGGVCQVSSTVYMAVLRADLEVTERSCHQFQVTYTPLSQDAAVYWGSKDFRFVNSTNYPIKVVMSASGGALNCQLIGTKTPEDEKKEISFYATSSSGSRGKSAALYKTVTIDGESTTTKVNTSYYMYH